MAAFGKKENRNRFAAGSRHVPAVRRREPLFSAFLSKAEEALEPQIQLQGQRKLYVEGCRAVVSCDENLVKLLLRGMSLTVLGAGLTVSDYTASTFTISGDIRGLELEPAGRKEGAR